MDRFDSEQRDAYEDLDTVESHQNDLALEEFPEGPYSSDLISESLGKSTPWSTGQRSSPRFGYENQELHAGLPRRYPGEDDNASIPEVQDEP
ncbi:hypothetical protein [Paenibacillus paeoniae]|uniref:Uncharacterized protein n=1 Tax=Paenibacillus paeoniae TaxID=2292705 RepID=A0A371PI64_9BACL|nr:hypothetical protein [Paenibacillus paeoniae]REK75824.1 hypothetical protein DX130_01735 [Paenibacillus paeoniae]